ncbi:MAG: Ig-like domain-containing protein, partial [Clostridia bacterium]|nr:Ig-like domain-containing protein [Clostridia bacterium]
YIKENNISLAKNDMIGRMYTWWESTVKKGLDMLIADGYTPVIKGMWWMQGEAEMFTEKMSSAYDELLTALISDVRNSVSEISGYDCSEMPFVFGLPIWNLKNSGTPPYQLDVRDNMQKVANDTSIVNVDCVDCAGLFQHDDWHFDARGQKYLGEQFIAKLETLTEGTAKLKEEVSTFSGPSIRFDQNGSLRFGAKIANYDVANGYKYGMLIVPTDYLTDNVIMGDYINAFKEKSIEVLNLECDVNQGDYNGDGLNENYIQGSITDIKYKNLDREFTGIAYIVDENGNYSFSGAKRDSLANLASNDIFNYSTTSNEYKTLLNYANGAINYKNGVAENKKFDAPSFDIVTPENFNIELGEKVVSKNLGVTQSPNMGYAVKYDVANTEIASVDELGNVTPKALGETTITVKCLDKTKTVNVTVTPVTIDGITLDCQKDALYGDKVVNSTLNDGRSYTVSALKTDSGIFVYSKGVFNTNVTSGANWWENTNFEFKLNGGTQSYVNVLKSSVGVTQFVYSVQQLTSGKYEHVVEFYVEKSLINNWSDTKDVQLNYAWKTPGEKAVLLTDALDYRYYNDWGPQDWHAFHRLGGLGTGSETVQFNPFASNLFISNSGLSYTEIASVDGVVSANEYPTASVTKSNANMTVKMEGKVDNSDLYLAFTITHSTWSAIDTGIGNWWKNDNLELIINGTRAVIMFYNGNLILPSHYACGKAVTTTDSSTGKLVTVLEVCFKGGVDAYKIKLGLNSTGTSFGWLGFMWGVENYEFEHGTVTSKGVFEFNTPTTLASGVVIDGNLTDSIWNSTVMANTVKGSANGATITIAGTKTADGIYLGATVTHKKAPNVSVDGSGNWYTYLNMEYRLNGTNVEFLNTCNNLSSGTFGVGFAKTTDNGDGTYTTVFELYVPNGAIGVTASQTSVSMVAGGWFESKFARLFGATQWAATHVITADGIKAIA